MIIKELSFPSTAPSTIRPQHEGSLMMSSALRAQAYPETPDSRRRFRFSLLTLFFTVVLLSWGAVVTSIEAGMAVPDWPTTFDSMDPINPTEGWYTIPAVLAEHGHRLIGMLVGLCTLILAGWTWFTDPRKWMKILGLLALGLVIVQGILGGLRVLWVSLDMAVIHACTAQLFLAVLTALALFSSGFWLKADRYLEENAETASLRRIAVMTAAGIYVQIILGALLRHPGSGANMLLASLHMIGAMAVFGLVFISIKAAKKADSGTTPAGKIAHGLAGALALQIVLGFLAFMAILIDASTGRSVLQVILSTAHMVVGSLLFAGSVVLALVAGRFAPDRELVGDY